MILNLFYLFAGILFGYVLILSGVSNYNVIYDMFLFKSFHLYGILGTAVGISFVFTHFLHKIRWKALLTKEEIPFPKEKPEKVHVIGGLLAGLGWSLTGACPGPALAQIGFGTLSGIYTVIGIFAGVYVFGALQKE
ncbi:MAG: YeeE/YedE family protein [Leptospiraceae bacterium]|nr:YeeE/YedE family protein [Leptospiraceae bacterium]MCP5502948.1 YeeE/YedE family protein [Leptospiraceae bacterium]